MSTDIIQCNRCEKVVKTIDAQGWIETKVYVALPSPEEYDRLSQDPSMRRQMELRGITKGAQAPALVGGDFCSLDCLVIHYEGLRTLEQMETVPVPDAPKHRISEAEARKMTASQLIEGGYEVVPEYLKYSDDSLGERGLGALQDEDPFWRRESDDGSN